MRHSVFSGITDSHGTVEVSLQLLIREIQVETQTSMEEVFFYYIIIVLTELFSHNNLQIGRNSLAIGDNQMDPKKKHFQCN